MTAIILTLLTILVIVPIAVFGMVYILVPFFKAIGWTVRQIARFIGGEIGDFFRIFGSLVTAIVLGLMVIVNIIIGRWSAAAHFGRAVQAEGAAMGAALYRMIIGHPARLLMMTALTEGLERRLPAVMAAAPAADGPALGGWHADAWSNDAHSPSGRGRTDGGRNRPKSRAGQFDGYTIVGSLPGGGSGSKLYIAEPDAIRQASFERAGHRDVGQVVVKSFSLRDGSSLPQIVRESRALDAAKRLGLVLDHELNDERFYYVMRYVPGESLTLVTQRLHATSDHSAGDGLDERHLRLSLSYAGDLLRTLETYHRGGLWHKDVKPDNIIVDRSSAHLVDFGLVTPLRSALTLTTHGTEYFRDPEMVRMALKGAKVHEVDGGKFDIYAAGAVLFSMIENSFPAHGGLSQITKRCPEALRWVVRRAMTDYDKRYNSASAMLADLLVIQTAADPFTVRPADLPSMSGAMADSAEADDRPIRPAAEAVRVGDGSGEPRMAANPGRSAAFAGTPVPPRSRPKIRVRDWWTGGFVVEDDGAGSTPPPPANVRHAAYNPNPWMPRRPGVSAQEQLQSARARAAQARQRAQQRMSQRRSSVHKDFSTFNAGVSASIMVFMAACILIAAFMVMMGRNNKSVTRMVENAVDASALYAQGQLPDGAIAMLPAVVQNDLNVRVSRSDRPSPRVVVQGQSATGSAAAALAETAGTGRRILVVSEAQPPSPSITSAINRLSSAGFLVMGNYPGNQAPEGDIQEQLLLEAEVKLTRGLGQLDAPDVSLTLSEWVGERDDVDLLVWFGRNGQKDSPMQYWLFRAPLERDDPRDSLDRAAFQNAVHLLGGPAEPVEHVRQSRRARSR